MTAHGATSSLCGEKVEVASMYAKASEDRLPPVPPPSTQARRSSLQSAPADLDSEDRDQRLGTYGAVKGSRTDSPIGRNSPAHSPLSRWLPSFRQAKSSDAGAGASVPGIHVNLFDAKFVNADSERGSLC